MIGKIKNFIVKLQNLDETAKKRWLIIFSAVAMLAVISLWALYVNLSIADVNSSPLAKNEKSVKNPEPDLGQILGAGLTKIGGEIKDKIVKLSSKNILTIQSVDRNFTVDDLEKIETVNLP
ncbi:MAG: hypothetical protein A3A16_04030 [Candidatus Harrisonbacteria bacterium RIFCSPLOWO2_01_FULL_44_18]|uniref:Uncharacterized protein n=1 Tax=Candidatus Harrisonbacteria bacterium RIFCSPLOWO2_01_FULL_44_18 TaxID=1798407 RepID=A0A1G1ZPS8_9BACT|nr:MAG: hypothetical protein A3A16_04030 [Candidatus Harrisonbacteria bacterium RIFCSPLOWO2_01_FULL_44_18]